MDFTLTTDIESELLHWDDDDDEDDDIDNDNTTDQIRNNAKRAPAAVPPVENSNVHLHTSPSVARGTISIDQNPNNHFNATAFADQSTSNAHTERVLIPHISKPVINSLHQPVSVTLSNATEGNSLQGPQHLADQSNFLETVFPPNYLLSGDLPWDPPKVAVNLQVPIVKMTAASNEIKSKQEESSNPAQVKVPAPDFEQEEWGASQISQHIAMHQKKKHENSGALNQDVQSLAAAAAAAAVAVSESHPEEKSAQGSQSLPITDGSTNTGSSASSNPSSSNKSIVKNSQVALQNDSESPPFYLFDAPCELRANFLQAQRQNEMTNYQDSNSFHYGMAVNGFHPQVNAQVNPIMPASLGAAVLPNGQRVELIDGRHKYKQRSSERNEREQQRAQKITELIDKLRSTMEQGGWKVEMKSKYQILSTSADYLKHLIKVTKEKEISLQKAKAERAIRNQKLEEDRFLQEGRSDPESVTSSLTAFSCPELKIRGGTEGSSINAVASSVPQSKDGLKRDSPTQDNSADPQDAAKKHCKSSEKNDDDSNHDSHQSSGNMGSSNSGSGHGMKNISIGKMSSSVSDMTDSNRGSSDGQATGSSDGQGNTGSSDGQGNTGSSDGHGNSNKEVKAAFDLSLLAKEESNSKTDNSSISSTAAVVSGVGSGEHDHRDTDIIFTKDRKRKRREQTSLDEGFQLSYQEVFLASNVPQLIATPAGRIVACNDFFFRVTGLTPKDVKKLTIFSMVQVDQLSTLFDLVADSLRKSNRNAVSCPADSIKSVQISSSSHKNVSNSEGTDTFSGVKFETATMPCVPFPQELCNAENRGEEKNLFMNVTFMYDANPSKRCIHCALTDEPGSEGKVGAITPRLLSMLFSLPYPNKTSTDKKKSSGNKKSI